MLSSLFPSLPQTGWAHFSDCRTYRYELWRRWADAPCSKPLVVIGLNPSTADEAKDDNTIRKVTAYAKAWGFSAFCMLNLFAYRATDPRELPKAAAPVGPLNDHHIRAVCAGAGMVLAAWGSDPFSWPRSEAVTDILTSLGIEPFCLGTTKDGSPRHPLYVKGSVTPTPWEVKI